MKTVPAVFDVARRDADRSICIQLDRWRNLPVNPELVPLGMNLGKVGPDRDRVENFVGKIPEMAASEEDWRREGAVTGPRSWCEGRPHFVLDVDADVDVDCCWMNKANSFEEKTLSGTEGSQTFAG